MRYALLTILLWLAALGAVLVPIAVRAQGQRLAAVSLAMPSVVMVLAVKVNGGELVPAAAGSGTIVSADGAILTNHHVLYDARDKRPHDLFLIGRFRSPEREPQLLCAGSPADGDLEPELDLALIRCDRRLDGQRMWPENWPRIPLGDSRGIVSGEQVWVLGYPNSGRGGIRVSAGLVSGWTGEEGGTASRAFMRTDASVSAGNSGGAAVDRAGRLIGVPTAFRVVSAEGGRTVTATGRIGLIRPIDAARDLLVGAPAAEDDRLTGSGRAVTLAGTVVEADSGRPVAGAIVLAAPAGTRGQGLDLGRIGPGTASTWGGQRVKAWGITDVTGAYRLEPPLARAQSYALAVTGPGYLPGIGAEDVEIPERGRHPVQTVPALALVRAGVL
jgi:S1-C subfamily serine protease